MKRAFTVLLTFLSLCCVAYSQAPITDTILYNFVYTELIWSPITAQMQLSPDGNFYGTAGGDTTNSKGGVYRFNPTTNTFTPIWTVPLGTATPLDIPQGVLAFDNAGNIYGASAGSGVSGEQNGAVWELVYDSGTDTYSETTLYTFTGGAAGGTPPNGVVRDSVGALYGTTVVGGTGGSCSNGCGIVWKLAKVGSTWTPTVLHNFVGTDGSYPYGALTLASGTFYSNRPQTHLYGTTKFGGSSSNCTTGCGTVFQVELGITGNPTNFVSLHSFTGTTTGDGAAPTGGVTLAPNGLALIGTSTLGGTSNLGTVWKIEGTANTTTILKSFSGTSDGATPDSTPQGDKNGNIYLTTTSGGAFNQGTITKLSFNGATGVYTPSLYYSFSSSGGDGEHPTGPAISGTTLYGATQFGGANSGDGHTLGVIYSVSIP